MKKFIVLPGLILLMLQCIYAQPGNYQTLDINNIRASFNPVGINFSDAYGGYFEAPKGSNNKPITCNTLWVTSKDIHSSVYLSGGVSSSTGKDYYPGPLTVDGTASTDSATMTQWNKVWKITRAEIIDHINNHGLSGYVIPQSIAQWPAHGDTTKHQAYYLAPFVDADHDGKYIPINGDYPLIKGDQAVFFIFNDKGGNHDASGGTPGGMEIHAMAYEFNCPSDTALKNTLFLNYKIYKRSSFIGYDMNMGIYSDFNQCDSSKQYIQSDIQRNLMYSFSAENEDKDYTCYYPATAVMLLKGPLMEGNFQDDPAYDSTSGTSTCDASVNGQFFGDGITDNECYGMTGFISYNNGTNPSMTAPENCSHYTKYLGLKWKDGHKLQYGGDGYDYLPPNGPDCRFMFPANSDPCNYGTDGFPPNGPVYWTEESASIAPGARHGIMVTSSSPCDPNDFKEIDLAFIYAIDYSKPDDVHGFKDKLLCMADSLKNYFKNDHTPCGTGFSGITAHATHKQPEQITLYPNPVNDHLTIALPDATSAARWTIYDVNGKALDMGMNTGSVTFSINCRHIPNGIYMIRIIQNEKTFSKSFIKQ